MNKQNKQLDQQEEQKEENGRKKEIDIMGMLKKNKLSLIKEDFWKVEKGLSLEQFLKVMLEHLDYEKQSKQAEEMLALELIDLFKEIDVNGDGTMEWDEFSNYIIELGLLRKDRTFTNIIKNYYPSENIIDRQKHENMIEQVYYFDKFLITLEKDNNKYKVYNAQNCDFICEVNAHKGALICAENIAEENMLATSSNDLTINFWDTSTFNIKQIVSTPEIQLCMKYANWNPTSRLLYTGGSDAIIHYYDTKTFKELGTLSGWNPFFKKDSQQFGHAGPIGDILPIISSSQQTLVSAGLDGKICLWDIPTHTFKKELTGHNKGVYSLAWSEDSPLNQCLLSAGLDHEVYVWNTYVKEKIFLLRGHNHPMVGVKCLPRSPQIITADISGIIKIWDVRNFTCMQTFQAPVDELNSFTITHPKKRIISAYRNLSFFEYDEPKDQELTDERYCIKIIFNSLMNNFITLHSDSIKVWDARNGHLLKVHRELSPYDLTQMTLDNRQRKLFVGDADGKIFTVNIKNGAKMKKFEKHTKIVQDLVYWTSQSVEDKEDNTQRRLISISRDTVMNVHDEDQQDPYKSVRYQMQKHNDGLNKISLKKNTELIGSCSDDGQIVLTNLSSYRSDILFNHSIEMKHILFLDHYDCLVAADSTGMIMFFAVGFTKIKNKKLTQKQYTTLSATNSMEGFPIKCMSFHPKRCQLLFGDDFGNVTIWDLTTLLLKLNQFHQEDRKYYKYKHYDLKQDLKSNIKITKQKSSLNQEQQIIKKLNNEDQSNTDLFLTNKLQSAKSKGISTFTDEEIKQIFNSDDVQFLHQIKNSHMDGITYLEVNPKLDIFATSSFDCCCYIWSFNNFKKIGSLILGIDKNWALHIDETDKIQQEKKECEELLETVKSKDYHTMFQSKKNNDSLIDKEEDLQMKEETKSLSNELNNKKDSVYQKARMLIDRHKYNLDQLEELKKKYEDNNNYSQFDSDFPKKMNPHYAIDFNLMLNEEEKIENNLELEDEENDNIMLNDLNEFKNQNTNNQINFSSKMNKKKKTSKFNLT